MPYESKGFEQLSACQLVVEEGEEVVRERYDRWTCKQSVLAELRCPAIAWRASEIVSLFKLPSRAGRAQTHCQGSRTLDVEGQGEITRRCVVNVHGGDDAKGMLATANAEKGIVHTTVNNDLELRHLHTARQVPLPLDMAKCTETKPQLRS